MDGGKASSEALYARWLLYRHHYIVHTTAVLVAGVATAWNSRENGFVWDDRAAVLNNRDVDTSATRWYECFAHDFWGDSINGDASHKSYRPLTTLTFRWNYFWDGYDAHAYHRTNIVVHAVCSLLVWRTACIVLYRYSQQSTLQDPAPPRWGALLAGLLFAVHPIHCDSVASIVGRADLLCVMYALSGFLCYSEAEKRDSWNQFAASIVLGVCASLSKELGFTVFGIYVVYEVLCAYALEESNNRISWSSPRGQRLMCLIVGGLGLTLMRLRVNGPQTTATFNILANSINLEQSRLVRMLSYAHVHAWYLWKLIWPSWFSFDYGFNTIPVIYSLRDARNVLTLMAYVLVFAGVIKALIDVKRSPLLLCIAFGVIPFIPASNIFFPVGTIVAERLLYFPSVGFCLIIGYITDQFNAALDRLEREAKKSAGPPVSHKALVVSSSRQLPLWFMCLILATAFHKSTIRNAEWQSEEVLFTKAVEVVPENVKALNNAVKVMLHSDPVWAFQAARAAVALLPNQVEGQSNYGLANLEITTPLLGIRHMLKAFAYGATEFASAGYTGAHVFNYWAKRQGLVHDSPEVPELLFRSSTIKMVTKFLDEAIRRGSWYPFHFFVRGGIAEQMNDYVSALRFMEQAQKANERLTRVSIYKDFLISPSSLINRIGVLRRFLGDSDRALADFLHGIDQYPAVEPSLYFNAASIYLKRGMTDWAATYLERCLEVCTHVESIRGGAQLLQNLGQSAAADAFFQRAEQLDKVKD